MKIPQNLRYLYFVVLIVMSIISISALQVTIDNMSIDVIYNQEYIIPITVINDKNYSLFNIDIDIDSEFPKLENIILNLTPGQNISTNLIFKTIEIGTFSEQIKFIPFQQKPCTLSGDVNIDITSSGLLPDTLSFCTGDTVIFKNTLNQQVDIVVGRTTTACFNSPSSRITFEPLQSRSMPVSILGIWMGICGNTVVPTLDYSVEVGDIKIFTHTSSDDFTLTLNIVSTLPESSLSIDSITQTFFTMDYDESKGGSIILRNTGDFDVVGVTFESDWIIPSKSGFTITKSQPTIGLDFTILPDILQSSDTNKTYIKNLIIKSQNSPNINIEFTIFINHAADIIGSGDLAYLIYLDEVFCPARPFSFLCEQAPRIIEKEVPKYACPLIIAEMTAEDILRIIDGSISGQRTAEAAFNLINLYADEQNKTLAQVFYELNLSNIIAEAQQKSIEDTNTTLFIIYFATTFIIIFGAGGWIFNRWYKSKRTGESYS